MEEFADDIFKFDENWQKAFQTGRKHCREKETLLVTSNFSFSHSVFKRHVLQRRTNKELFRKGLRRYLIKECFQTSSAGRLEERKGRLRRIMCKCRRRLILRTVFGDFSLFQESTEKSQSLN